MTDETNVDVVMETKAPIAEASTADAVRRTYDDDREERVLLEE